MAASDGDPRQGASSAAALENRLRTLVEHTAEWIWEMDLDGRHTYSNRRLEHILGYSPGELVHLALPELLHPDDMTEVAQRLPRLIEAREGWRGWVVRFRHKDGGFRHLESNAEPILDAAGDITGFRGVDRDITERLLLEERLRQSQKMDAIGRLAGGVAHDFNNILTAVSGFATYARRALEDDHPASRDIDEVLRAVEQARALTSQLLGFSRMKVAPSEVFDLNTSVGELEKMLRRLVPENITLALELDVGAGSVRLPRGQLEQLVLNLALNACDAMPDGGSLRIATGRVQLEQDEGPLRPGTYGLLSVSDAGRGIAKDHLDHIFEPFFTTDKDTGTGLGLAIVHGIAREAGGDVEVETALGHGSTFKVLLPASDEIPQQPRSPATDEHVEARTATILVVEDEPAVLETTRRALDGAGHQVLCAASAAEALLIVENLDRDLDLLLTDVVMPMMSGPELAHHLTRRGNVRRVLFMTGYADASLSRELDHYAAPVILKPFTPTELIVQVGRAL